MLTLHVLVTMQFFYESIGKRLVVEKKFSITSTHTRLKSEKEIDVYKEKEGERESKTVNRSLLVRERTKYSAKRTWHATLFWFFLFSLFLFLIKMIIKERMNH
jgi:hypothetical protein